jgi:hypothetical protein
MHQSLSFSALVLLYHIPGIFSIPSDTLNLFRRDCGGALAVVEGAPCNSNLANSAACADSCSTIVNSTPDILFGTHKLTVVCRSCAHRNPQIPTNLENRRRRMHPIRGNMITTVMDHTVRSRTTM